MVYVLHVTVCVRLESCLCLTLVNVSLSLNRQELPTVAPPTPIQNCHHNPYLCLKPHFSQQIDHFFFPPLFFHVSAATNVAPNRLEISEWRDRQEDTGPPRPLLSPSSSVQWTDRHCRWFSPLPPPPPDLGPPAAALLWDSSNSASTEKKRLIKAVKTWKTTSSYWHFAINIQNRISIKPVSFSHPTLNLYCEMNSTLFCPSSTWPQNRDWKQSFFSLRALMCDTHTLQNTQIRLFAVRHANVEQCCGQKVKGQREYLPFTPLDPIY